MIKRALYALCFAALVASHASAAVTFISTCGVTISQPGQYHLSKDLTNCSGLFAIYIIAPDVELHFDGHTISGNHDPAHGLLNGVEVLGDNASILGSGTVTNCMNAGLLLYRGGVRVVNMTLTHNRRGINTWRDATLISNTATGNGWGFDITGSGVIARSNQVEQNSIGIRVGGADCLIQANTALNNGLDLTEDDGTCTTNTWKSNKFVTSDPSCIR